jgi:hypothetical protein
MQMKISKSENYCSAGKNNMGLEDRGRQLTRFFSSFLSSQLNKVL